MVDKVGLNPIAFGLERPIRAFDEPSPEKALRVVEPMVEPAPPGREDIDTAVRDINEAVQVVRRNLQFSVNEDSGRIVITVMDAETREVVRQIPPEKLVAAAENLAALRGLLYEDEV